MLVSKNLLMQIDNGFKKITNEQLVNSFNSIGIEVEKIIKFNNVEGLIPAKIIDFKKIENSNKLNFCTVETLDGIYEVVCGAKNLKKGAFVVFAKPGTKFSDDFIIQKREIFGHTSNGMICAYSEINNDNAHYLTDEQKKEVIILDKKTNLKTNIYEHLGLDDTIFEISIPSNRNDLNGILSIINELKYRLNLKFELNFSKVLNKCLNSNLIKIESKYIDNYLFFELKLNELNFSTSWKFKSFLLNSHINLTNTIVDYANFVTLLTANPIHLYDLDKLNDSLIIKEISNNENIQTLNSQNIELHSGTVCGINQNKIVSVIGLIGVNNFKVDNFSKNILVEILNIDNKYIKDYGEKNKIFTNAQNLFSKKLSSYFIDVSYNLFLDLLIKNKINFKNKLLSYKNEYSNIKIKFDLEKINNFLGIKLSISDVKKILTKTGFKFDKTNKNILVPYWKIDVVNIQDISEEILKSLNINEFESEPIVSKNIIKQDNNVEFYLLNNLAEKLVNLGFFEVKTMNLVSLKDNETFNTFNIESFKIKNPISNQRTIFRSNLVSSLLNVLKFNLNCKNELFNFFEIQKIYPLSSECFNNLTIVLTKQIVNKKINVENDELIVELNFLINELSKILNIQFEIKKNDNKNTYADLYFQNEYLGKIYKFNKKELINFEIKINEIFALEINLNSIFKFKKNINWHYNTISNFNNVYRQLTILNPENIDINLFLNKIKNINFIKDSYLKDIYIDKNSNEKTYNIEFIINSNEKTLSNEEINEVFNQCIKTLNDFNLKLKNNV